MSGRTRRGGQWAAAAAIAAALVLAPALRVVPVDLDNLLALSVASSPSPAPIVLNTFVTSFPGYRPLPLLTVWAQYRWTGLDGVWLSAFNLAAWLACGALVYACVHRLTSSALLAASGALVYLFDGRQLEALVWIGERQTTLAVVLGLLAVRLVWPEDGARTTPGRSALAGGLLLASALCKEYGLAFSAAVVAVGWHTAAAPRWSRLLRSGPGLAALGALVVYAAIRLMLVPVPPAGLEEYCTPMGYFGAERLVCYGSLDAGARLAQHAYNVVTTFIGTFLPSAFDATGRIRAVPTPTLVFVQAPVTIAACVGFARRWRETAPLFVLLCANAILSFMLYRMRNQIVGFTAVYIAAAAGAHSWRDLAGRPSSRLVRQAGLLAWIGAAVLFKAFNARASVESYTVRMQTRHPCIEAARGRNPQLDWALVDRVRRQYGFGPPACAP